MWFNAIIRAKPYQSLMFEKELFTFWSNILFFLTGVAWLSSARVVKCLVKSFNERNPFFLLLFFLRKYFEDTNCYKQLEEG